MKLLPQGAKQIPLYMSIYWTVIWIFYSIIIFTNITNNATNGVVYKRDCIKYKGPECTVNSRLYQVPVEKEIIINVVSSGIIIGGLVLVGGLSQLLLLTVTKKKSNVGKFPSKS